MLSLHDALEPRDSVFDLSRRDTVYNLSDLDRIDARSFFEENFLTAAMKILLPEAFKRLEQRSDSSAGVFRLSQAMGGGKTHSLVALGLLAKHQDLRAPVLRECGYDPGPLGRVRVVAFSGGADTTPYGLWGFIAQKLGVEERLSGCYTPLRNPSEREWEEALAGEPTLLLIDELPLYLVACRATQVGGTTLDVLTALALRTLFQVIHSNRLPNVCLVLTDLAGTAWRTAGEVPESIADLDREMNRVAMSLIPVDLASDDLYQILRKRLFKRLPGDTAIAEVADGYIRALETAKNMGLVADIAPTLQSKIVEAYPFHPAIRDLYARVKENSGFQQTRALLRIMRLVVRRLWQSGASRNRYLIGAHDFDLLDQAMKSEIAQINPTFEAAIAKDVQDSGGGATAQRIDGDRGRDAQDAAKLLLLSSLSTAVNPTLGLHRTEIAEFLAEPGRDLSRLREAIDQLQERAWYVHTMPGSKLVFRNVQNLVAKVEDYVRNTTPDMREQEVRRRLESLFAPSIRDCYQEVLVFPSFDRVTLDRDKVTLVIYKPTLDSKEVVRQFFETQPFKNRVCFLTSEQEAYLTALERAAYLNAIERATSEPEFADLHPNDPQRKQAEDLKASYRSRLYQALVSGFCKLSYPWREGLHEVDLEGRIEISDGAAVDYRGEMDVRDTLIRNSKFIEDSSPDELHSKIERIWPSSEKRIQWVEVLRRAAANTAFVWHHPRALEDLEREMMKKDLWREVGDGWIEKGPFPPEPTRVEVDLISQDYETGEATIRIRSVPSDALVYHDTSKEADENSVQLTEFQFKTAELWHSFLAVDPSGKHPRGSPRTWTLTPIVKHGFPSIDGVKCVELVALPRDPEITIRYTDDGSSLETSAKRYEGPFPAPPGALIQARAEYREIKGQTVSIKVPLKDRIIVPDLSAKWKPRAGFALDSSAETYRFLDLAEKFHARLGSTVRLIVSREGKTAELMTIGQFFPADRYKKSIDELRYYIPDPNVSLNLDGLFFDTGSDLSEFAKELPREIEEDEVTQPGGDPS